MNASMTMEQSLASGDLIGGERVVHQEQNHTNAPDASKKQYRAG
jgi:hypothetical protein